MNRRNFLKNGAVAATGTVFLPQFLRGQPFSTSKSQIRVGFVGVGLRGRNHLELALRRDDVIVAAICDIQEEPLQRSREMIQKANKPMPAIYTGDLNAYKRMLD